MKKLIILTALFSASLSGPAFAYLDPGTGSIVLQAILGSVAVAGAAVSAYWRRIRLFISTSVGRKKRSSLPTE